VRTEEALRRPKSEAHRLVARLRAGTLTDAHVRLAALLGHEASREVKPDPEIDWVDGCLAREMTWSQVDDFLPLAKWVEGLSLTLARLPAIPVEEECDGTCWLPLSSRPKDFGKPLNIIKRECDGRDELHVIGCIGKRTALIPAERWWSVRAAVAAARTVLKVVPCGWIAPAACRVHGIGDTRWLPNFGACREGEAVLAAEWWLKDPTEAKRAATNSLVNPAQNRPDWAYQPLRMVYAWDGAARQSLRIGLASAAKFAPTLREDISATLVPLVLA